jgi:hypothetical protein
LVAFGIAFAHPSAVAADRLTDREVKALIDQIDQNRDRFVDALDDKLKNNILRTPKGEVDVKRYLDDFNENIRRLKDRLKPEYAASAEAAAVLRQGSAIQAFFKGQPPGTRGESEWNRLASDLSVLAKAYGAAFPVDEQTPVRRVGDRELVAAANVVAKTADRLKKSVDDDLRTDVAVDRASREAAVVEAEELEKAAKALRDRVKGNKPSSAEAERLLAGASKMQTFINGRRMPSSSTVWVQAPAQLQTVASAYGTAWPPEKPPDPQNARTVCSIGTQPVIPAVYGVKAPLYGARSILKSSAVSHSRSVGRKCHFTPPPYS